MDGLGHGSQPYFSTLLAYHTSTRVCGMNARPHQATARHCRRTQPRVVPRPPGRQPYFATPLPYHPIHDVDAHPRHIGARKHGAEREEAGEEGRGLPAANARGPG